MVQTCTTYTIPELTTCEVNRKIDLSGIWQRQIPNLSVLTCLQVRMNNIFIDKTHLNLNKIINNKQELASTSPHEQTIEKSNRVNKNKYLKLRNEKTP